MSKQHFNKSHNAPKHDPAYTATKAKNTVGPLNDVDYVALRPKGTPPGTRKAGTKPGQYAAVTNVPVTTYGTGTTENGATSVAHHVTQGRTNPATGKRVNEHYHRQVEVAVNAATGKRHFLTSDGECSSSSMRSAES